MSRAIIILVGTSLLTKHIEKITLYQNKFDEFAYEFLNGYNIDVHRKIEDIIEIINPEKKRQITEHLKDTVGPLNLNEASAETNSLSHSHLQKEDILYFLSSNTLTGNICANVFPVKNKKIIQDFKNYIDGELNAPHVKEVLANNLIDFEVEAGKLLP